MAVLVWNPTDSSALYVAKTGNDSTGDGSYALPYLTIAKASTIASSNAAIKEVRVLAGTYSEIVQPLRSNLTYRAIGDASTVIIDGGGSNKAFYTASYSNINIIGFTATNGSWLFDSRAGNNVRYYNCIGHDCLRAWHIAGTTNAYLYNCLAYNTSDTNGAYYLSSGATGAYVKGCEAYAATGRGFYCLGAPSNIFVDCYVHDPAASSYGFEVESSSDDCQYIRCWAIGVGSSFLNGMISKTSLRTRMEGCVINKCSSAGFYFKNGSSGWLYNSVAYDANRGLLLAEDPLTSPSPSINNTIRNNVFVSNTTYGVEIDSGSQSGLTLDYNDYYGNGTVAAYLASGKSFAQLQALGYEANGFTTNPAYVSTIYGGFALPSGNALKNAGQYLGGTDTTPDLGREGSQWNGRGYS